MMRCAISFGHRKIDKHLCLSLSNELMLEVVSVVCGQKLVGLAALDSCSELHGRQNFLMIRKLLKYLLALQLPAVLLFDTNELLQD